MQAMFSGFLVRYCIRTCGHYRILAVRASSNSVFQVVDAAKESQQESVGHTQKKKRKWGPGAFILLCLPAATLYLGIWQLERRKWKLALIEDLEKKNKTSVLPLPQSWDEFEGMEYQKYVLTGEFDHSKEIVLHPRMQKTEAPKNKFEQRARGPVGAHVVTPFRIKDRGITVLVNRGWVPKSKMDPSTRIQGQINGVHKMIAMYRPSQKKSVFVKENIPEQNHYFYRDVEAMAQHLNTEPVYFEAVTDVPGGPMGDQVALQLRNVHAIYAVQWFTLTFFGGLLWYMRYIR